jgi:hypothetical protein
MILILASRNNCLRIKIEGQQHLCGAVAFIDETEFISKTLINHSVIDNNGYWNLGDRIINFNEVSGILNQFISLNLHFNNAEDAESVVQNYTAYLSFALIAHANTYNLPLNGNINSELFSMLHFWEYLKGKNIQTPKWGISEKFISDLSKKELANLIYSSNPYNYNNWRAGFKNDSFCFCFVRPNGQAIRIAFIEGYFISDCSFPTYVADKIMNIISLLMELKINFGELLLFLSNEKLTFGRYSSYPDLNAFNEKLGNDFVSIIINKLNYK